MSEILRVAAALRRSSDEELRDVIAQRMVSSSTMRDFFDLADALTKPSAVSSTVAGLSRTQAIALQAIADGEEPNFEAATELAKLMLVENKKVDGEAAFIAFESTLTALRAFKRTASTELLMAEPSSSQHEVDRDASVAIFETMQALTELVFDIEQRFVREVGKKNVGLPDIKRLATHLRKPNEYAKAIYELANLSQLITLAKGRWQLGRMADSWIDWSPTQRFEHLAKTWRTILGEPSANELILGIGQRAGTISLREHLASTYPFADSAVSSRIAKVAEIAELVGISANGLLSSWASDVLHSRFDLAPQKVAELLPIPQARLICQADLSLIAPGPLPTEIEITLRKFADTEQIGMASTYRLSALSISHGLETGLTETEIRSLLETLSGKALPQPIDYLIRESVTRFGRLTIAELTSDGEPASLRSHLKSSDPILLAQIFNDIRLKPFALREVEDGSLASRFEPEVLYFGLREVGFSAVRVGADGSVLSPRTKVEKVEAETELSTIETDIARLREHEAKLGEEPDGDDVLRQISLAIKNKAKIDVTVVTAAGAEIEYTLEPIGIANGRLRAKDRKADIERTLPLTSITKVRL